MIKKLIILLTTAVLVGCGGGGGAPSGSDTPDNPPSTQLPEKPQSSKMAKLNSGNKNTAALSAYRAIIAPPDLNMENQLLQKRVKRLKKMAKLIDKSYKKYDRSSQMCSSGKAYVYTKTETSGTVVFKNCQMDEYLVNGTVYVDEEDTQTFQEYKNFTVTSEDEEAEIKHLNFTYYDYNDDYKMEDYYATYRIYDKTLEYLNFNLQKTSGPGKVSLLFNGYIKPVCLDGFVYIKSNGKVTDTEDEYDENKTVTQGAFFVSSRGDKINVEIDKDLVYVKFNSENEETYLKSEIEKTLGQDSCIINIKPTLPYRPKSSEIIKFNSLNVKNVAIASVSVIDIDFYNDFPLFDKLFSLDENSTSCISGSASSEDRGSSVILSYANCQRAQNIFYSGKLTYHLNGGEISKITTTNLKIKNLGTTTDIKNLEISKYIDDTDTDIKLKRFYGSITKNGAKNEYLDYNYTKTVESKISYQKGDIYFEGYAKPSCLGRYIYLDSSSASYDENGTINYIYYDIGSAYSEEAVNVDYTIDKGYAEIYFAQDDYKDTIDKEKFLKGCSGN